MAIAGSTLPSAGLRWDPDAHTLTVAHGLNKGREVLLIEVSDICAALVADPRATIDVATNRYQVSAVIDMMTADHGLLHVVRR